MRHRTLRWSPEYGMWVPRDFAAAVKQPRAARPFTPGQTERYIDRRQRTLGAAMARRPASPAEFDAAREAYGHKGPYMPVLIYAAGQTEFAAEYSHGSISQGAFTFCLAKRLRASTDSPPTFEQLVLGVRADLSALAYQQTPEIVGPSAKIAQPVPINRWKVSRTPVA